MPELNPFIEDIFLNICELKTLIVGCRSQRHDYGNMPKIAPQEPFVFP